MYDRKEVPNVPPTRAEGQATIVRSLKLLNAWSAHLQPYTQTPSIITVAA
jgi:hypothetical protein